MSKPQKTICAVTGSRAEYGLLQPLLKKIQAGPVFKLQMIVTGAHLSADFGLTYREIERDGFRIDEKIEILSGDTSTVGVTRALGKATVGFASAFERLKPDLLLLLGDRYEILAAAQAALIARIPVAHIAGGDSTEGAFDEAIRHSITKMSHLHFVTNEAAAKRVCQLGENPQFVFNVGSTGIDQLKNMKLAGRAELEKNLGFKFLKKNLLITFHPATLDQKKSTDQFQELLAALDGLGDGVGLLFTGPNADTEGLLLRKMMDEFAAKRANAKVFLSLGPWLYLSAMKEVNAMVGNSSSGLYEAPSFQKPAVNIGDRQKGRLRASSVIDCEPEHSAIRKAIESAFTMDCSDAVNPYGDGSSSERILEILKQIAHPEKLLKKSFSDQPSLFGSGRTFVIAEAGVNHNGSLEMAKKLIDAAAEAGADAVKFQTFVADKLVSRAAPKAEYQKRNTASDETQWQMIKQLELGEKEHRELAVHCRERRIEFLSTPFDLESLEMLSGTVGLRRVKISSGEVTNAPLILEATRRGLSLILSTGMSTLEEVEKILGVAAFGYTRPHGDQPTACAFEEAFRSVEGRRALGEKVVLLHCTTEYPAPYEEVNLLAMDTLRSRFGLPVGLSDHTLGFSVSLAAVARAAVVVEKHITLDRGLPGPDHKVSLEPEEFKAMVGSIRQIEKALGSPRKAPAPSELKNIPVVRKSIVAVRDIRKGEIFTEENLTVKRPGTGVSPMRYWEVLGRRADKDYRQDEAVVV